MDDNIFNILAATILLEEEPRHLKCESALNGKLALEAVIKRDELVASSCTCGEKGNYKLILMDCNMPVLDGFEATRLIRQYLNERGIQQPLIVAVTAYNTQGFEEKCYESGMDKFMTKPIEFTELDEIVKELF